MTYRLALDPQHSMPAATIRDVAKAVGLSVATVSRAINGFEHVLPHTRQRVLDAARHLHYIPSGAARSMALRRTDTIGALLPELHGGFFSELIRGIDQATRSHRSHLLLSSSHDDADEAAAALQAMNGRVDGLIVMSPHADADFLARNLPRAIPVVLLNAGIRDSSYPSCTVDNFGGARAMTRHLLATGHQRLGFLGGPSGNFEARERKRGFLSALGGHGSPLLLDGDFSEASGAHAAARLLGMPAAHRPNAVFAANDAMAIALMANLIAGGLRVPQDIAITGFDDIALASHVNPPLTTVHVPIAALGMQALDVLSQHMCDGGDSVVPTNHLVPVELVVRHSCGGALSAQT